MYSYKIITDSCCDLTNQQYRELDVAYVSLSILYKGATHSNFSDENKLREFYNSLRSGETATTSAANPENWASVIEPVLAAGQDVLVLTFSSALSTTYQSAVIAAEDLREKYPQRKIHVVDTLCAAHGQGLLVWYASQKRKEGMSLDELTAWCEENKLHICHWVTVDDLSHLKRGGRVSATTAFVGTMLNIKPIICMDDEGKLTSVSKVRGRKAAMEYLVNKLGESGKNYNNDTVFISHGDCPEDAQQLPDTVQQKHGPKNIVIGYVGGVIGSHTGPGVLVIYFMGDHR